MKDPIPTFSHIITAIRDRYPDFGYIHLVEPRVSGPFSSDELNSKSNETLRKIWSPRAYLTAGGYTREDAIKAAEEQNTLVVFGRPYTSNVSHRFNYWIIRLTCNLYVDLHSLIFCGGSEMISP